MEVIVTPPKFNGNSRRASENSKLQKRLLDLFGESPEAPKTCSYIAKRHEQLFGPSPTDKSKSTSKAVKSVESLKKKLFGDSPQKKDFATATPGHYISILSDTPTKIKLKKVTHSVDQKEEAIVNTKINNIKTEDPVSLKPASQHETPPKIKPNGLPVTPGSEFKIPEIPKLSKSKSTRRDRDEKFLERIFKEMCIFDVPKLLSPLKKTPEKITKPIKTESCNLHGKKTSKNRTEDKELDTVFNDANIFKVPKLLSLLKRSPDFAKPKKTPEKMTAIYELSLPEDGQIFTAGNAQNMNDEIEDLYEQFCYITELDDLKAPPRKVQEVSLNKVPKYLGKIKQSSRGESVKV